MPHQCVRCGELFDDGSSQILTGCNCGAKLFFYVRKESLEKAKEIQEKLSESDRKQVEKDVLDMVDVKDDDSPIILDFESIRISKPGKFELDLVQLFDSKNPLVYKLEDGKYIIDVAQTFERNSKK